jgi:iron complex outermembrane recepter protein
VHAIALGHYPLGGFQLMKSRTPRISRHVVSALLPALFTLGLSGQVAPAPISAPPPGSEETIELSPFIVAERDDGGYAPTETLSGTRLRTQTKNVASAMSIVTAEFLRDIGAMNFNDVVDFLPSTFSYGTNEGDATANGLRTGSPFYVRGYRSDSQSTNFFTAFFPIDSYNTSRMTFTRGPNSILFGIGNPGGALDITSNKAELTRNSHRLELRVDSFDSFRTALDSNVVVVPQKLALRLDLLHDDRGSNIKPSKNVRDSAFGTVTWQATRNSAFFLNVETNHQVTQIPRPYEYYDWYNLWAAAGRPIKAVARNTAANPGWEFQSGNGYPVVVPGVGVMDWASMAFGARPTIRGARESKLSYGAGTPNRPVPLDANIVGNGDRMTYDNDNYTLIFQQRLASTLYLEVAGKHDHTYRENRETDGNVVAIQVDPNAQLPNGQPNPNVGLPYVEIRPTVQRIPTDIEQLRATLTYERDLGTARVFNRRLGRISLGGLYNNEANHQFLEQYAETNETPLSAVRDLSDTRNLVRRRWYFTGAENYYAGDFEPVSGNGVQSGWERVSSTPRNNFTRTISYSLAGQALLLDDLIALTGGIRRDEILVTQVNYVKDARGVWGDARSGTAAPALEAVGRPYLYGAVINVLPNLGLFFNRAINFRAFNQSNRTIFGNLIPPQAGRGIDTGIKFNLLDNRISGSFDYFETQQTNLLDSTLRGRKAAWMNSIWEVVDPTRRPDTSWTDLKNQKTYGVEFQLVANPTKNLRLMANASRNISVLEDHGGPVFAYLAANYPVWQGAAATRLTSSLADGATVGDLVQRIQAEESDDRRVIGIKQSKVYEWQANFVGRYQLPREGRLKGFAVGSTFRWRSAPVIGFYRLANTVLDPAQPIKGHVSTNVDGWLEYGRTFNLAGRKLRWDAQIRVQNLLNDRTLQLWQADVDNNGNVYIQQRRTPGERQYVLSSTFSF